MLRHNVAMTVKRAAIYCRISQDREGAGLGVERQHADCESLALKLGWTVVATHVDNDLSAYSGKPRPGYRALLDDITAGRADGVIVWHTDRLHRSPRELEEYVDLCERRKVTTQTVKAGELDLATPSGRAVARTLGAWARFEVEHKSERTRRAQLQAAQAGRWLGGAPPLGWNVKADGNATLDRPASARIRKATTAILAGASLGSIVKAWNDAKFRTGTYAHGCADSAECRSDGGKHAKGVECPERIAREWNYTSLRQVLTRARNAGLIEYNGEIVAHSSWPAIVTEDAWRSLCSMLANPDRRRSQSNRAKWLLSGIAVCGKEGCGEPLRSATVGTRSKDAPKRTVYRCVQAGTGHVARSAIDVDAFVMELVAERFSQANVRDMLPVGTGIDVTDLQGESVALRARLDEAAESFADGAITGAQLGKITARINDRLAEVDAALSAAARGSALGEFVNAHDPAKQWRKATIERQRAALAEMLTVTILPGLRGRKFDPDLIDINWRNPIE
jgi:site-specific DNA recombinase